MKRYISIAIIITMLFALCACAATNKPAVPGEQTEQPTWAATEAPSEEPTEAPTQEPTQEPTGEPQLAGIEDFCKPLDVYGENSFDIDFDGEDDQLSFKGEVINEWDDKSFELSVVTAAGVEKKLEISLCYDLYAWIVDCDPTDSRLDIILTNIFESDDWTTYVLRLNDAGTDFIVAEDWFEVSSDIETVFTSEGGFPVIDRTDILGTRHVTANMTMTEEGLKLVSDEYLYIGSELEIELIKDLPLTALSEDGAFGQEYKAKAGTVIIPYATDMTSYVKVKLPDGRIGVMNVEIVSTDTEYGIYLNGVNQDEYAQMPYAD